MPVCPAARLLRLDDGEPLAGGPAPGWSGWGLQRRERHRLLDSALEMESLSPKSKTQKLDSEQIQTVQTQGGGRNHSVVS